jgi:hypothetical protein
MIWQALLAENSQPGPLLLLFHLSPAVRTYSKILIINYWSPLGYLYAEGKRGKWSK